MSAQERKPLKEGAGFGAVMMALAVAFFAIVGVFVLAGANSLVSGIYVLIFVVVSCALSILGAITKGVQSIRTELRALHDEGMRLAPRTPDKPQS